MRCPSCQAENREDAKFCNDCGNKLELACSKCGNLNRPGSRFCDECGHKLTAPSESLPRELSFDERIAKIQRYLPKGVTEKVLSQRDKIEGERKQVTVMFCDMEGFTTLSEKLGPEETYAVMDQVYEILIHKIHDYEGTVNEMTGDGILALFGAPIALEDAPQRAIRSAYAIHLEMRQFSDKIKQERAGVPPIKMRIGIHTGPVVVGSLGNDLRVEFKAVGDTVNVAARIEQLAGPGSILITEDTHRLVEGLFRCEALGKVEVRGKRQPVFAFRVLGPGKSRSRFEARAEKGLTRFVGRERELEILWDCFERTREGKGQALSIVAEAGMGKSRLLYEFRKGLTNEAVTFLEGRCLSYGQNAPYLPVIDILRENFRIETDDPPGRIQEKIKRGLDQIGADSDNTLPYLLELFFLENGSDALKFMDPESKRRKTFEALREITLRGSQRRPLVMAFEDLHWIDKTSEEILRLLVEHIAGARVFLIFTFRSNYLAPWGGKSYYNQINLNRLSNRESLHMIRSILDAEEIEEALAGYLLERAEGIPFFIEEFSRALLESGAVLRADGRCYLRSDLAPIAIPETLHDVLMARVDKLPEGTKDILRVGSVIEREFGWALIKELTGIHEMELLSHLSQLKDAELIFERGIFPQVNYVFQHAITQELLYNSLLATKRREYHRDIGSVMERLYSGHLEEHSAMLALHFSRGGDTERGYRYHHMAGDRAAAAFANREAMAHFKEAWRLIDQEGKDHRVLEKRLDTAIKLAEVMEPLGEFEPTLKLLEEVLARCTVTEDPERYAKVQYWMGNTYGNLGRYDEARKHLLRALELSEISGNRETQGNAHNYLSQLDSVQGYLKRGMDHAEAAVRCLRDMGNPTRLAWALVFRAFILCDLKRMDEWPAFMEEMRAWVQLSANDRVCCLLDILDSLNMMKSGRYEEALKIAMEGLERAETIGEGIQKVFLLGHAGRSALYSGRGDDALDLLQRGNLEGNRVGHPLGVAIVHQYLAEALLRLGRPDEAMEPAEEALRLSQKLEMGFFPGAWGIMAEILANRTPIDRTRIAEMMGQATQMVERRGSPWTRIEHLMVQARISLRLGELDVARESLLETRSLYEKVGLREGTEVLRCLEDSLNKLTGTGGSNVCGE